MRNKGPQRLNSQVRLDPGKTQLLFVDDAVAVHDVFYQLLALFLVHAPDVVELFSIGGHEMPEKESVTLPYQCEFFACVMPGQFQCLFF